MNWCTFSSSLGIYLVHYGTPSTKGKRKQHLILRLQITWTYMNSVDVYLRYSLWLPCEVDLSGEGNA